MGQTLGLGRRGGVAEYSNGRSGTVLSSTGDLVNGYDTNGDVEGDSWSESEGKDEGEVMGPLEELADEFMKTLAFSHMASRYGIDDEYLSGDFPMEVCTSVVILVEEAKEGFKTRIEKNRHCGSLPPSIPHRAGWKFKFKSIKVRMASVA